MKKIELLEETLARIYCALFNQIMNPVLVKLWRTLPGRLCDLGNSALILTAA